MNKYLFLLLTSMSIWACQEDDVYISNSDIVSPFVGVYKGKMNTYIADMHTSYIWQQINVKFSGDSLNLVIESLRVKDVYLGDVNLGDVNFQVDGEKLSFETIANCKLNNIPRANVVLSGAIVGEQCTMKASITSMEIPDIHINMEAYVRESKEGDSCRIISMHFLDKEVVIQPKMDHRYRTATFFVSNDVSDSARLVLRPYYTLDPGATSSVTIGDSLGFMKGDTLGFTDKEAIMRVWAEDSIHCSDYKLRFKRADVLNHHFDLWERFPYGEKDENLTYLQPTNWMSNNELLLEQKKNGELPTDNDYLVKLADMPIYLDYSACLKTELINKKLYSGTIFRGEYQIKEGEGDHQNYHFGQPFYKEPIFISGEYRYANSETYTDASGTKAEGVDSCMIRVVLYQVNSENEFLTVDQLFEDKRIIAETTFTGENTDEKYVSFSSQLKYMKPYVEGVNYRLALIVSPSKSYLLDGSGANGSVMYINNLNVVSR